MSDIINEKLLEDYPKPITLESTNIIIKQMEKSICKIINKKGKGTGFFCYIKDIPVMITNNHIINEEIIKENNILRVTLNNDKDYIDIKINENTKIYTSSEKVYDTTIIDIKSVKEKEKIKFLELDKSIFEDISNIYNENVYIIQYPEYDYGQRASVSYGILKSIEDGNIIHKCNTKFGSSGSPILNIIENKIIGIHKAGSTLEYNKGTFLKYPIEEFLNNKNLIVINKNKTKNKVNLNNNINILSKNTENELIKKNNNIDITSKNSKNQ